MSTNKVYAAIHQFGGQIVIPAHSETHIRARYKRKTVKHRKGQFKRGQLGNQPFGEVMPFGEKMVNIPARPFLNLPETGLEKIRRLISDHFSA